MKIDRRTLLTRTFGHAAGAAPGARRDRDRRRRTRDADARQGRARLSRRAAGLHHALYVGAGAAARLDAQPIEPEECEFLLPGRLRQARGRAHHRARQHRQSRSCAHAQARSHSRRRHRQRHLCLARRPRAGADRHSLCAARRPLRRDRAGLSQARRADRPASPGRRASRATPTTRSTTIKGRIDKIAEEQRPRVYYARGPRGLETGLGGSINVETIEFLARQRRRPSAAAASATVSIEQVLAVESRRHHHHRPGFRRRACGPIRSGRRSRRCETGRVHLSPQLPFGWVDFPPSVNRLIGLWWLAKILYPGSVPGGSAAADARFLSAVLSRDADRRADRRCAGGPGLIFDGMTRSALPGLGDRARRSDRRTDPGLHGRPLSGRASAICSRCWRRKLDRPRVRRAGRRSRT